MEHERKKELESEEDTWGESLEQLRRVEEENDFLNMWNVDKLTGETVDINLSYFKNLIDKNESC